MAAKPKTDTRTTASFTVKGSDFNRMMDKLDNPPKSSGALRHFVASGKSLLANGKR